MEFDRKIFGTGPYPTTGWVSVLARLGFLVAGLAIVVAVFLPEKWVPQFHHSTHMEHFAAFYVETLLALAALPGIRVLAIGLSIAGFGIALEFSHLLTGMYAGAAFANSFADVAGVEAAIAPLIIERFRQRRA